VVLVYATRDDLIAYVPADVQPRVPTEPEATRLLTSASKEILRATKTALYDTDTDGYPTDIVIRQAFRDAACAQAEWWLTGGSDEQGAETQYQTVSIGSMTLARGQANSAQSTPPERLAPKAATELDNAGISPGVVITWL
jgi:hypothetical protein